MAEKEITKRKLRKKDFVKIAIFSAVFLILTLLRVLHFEIPLSENIQNIIVLSLIFLLGVSILIRFYLDIQAGKTGIHSTLHRSEYNREKNPKEFKSVTLLKLLVGIFLLLLSLFLLVWLILK
jgi:hypothetical protein